MKLHREIFNETATKYPPVYLLHGFTGSAEDWRQTASGILIEYPVYAIDLPGHGKNASVDDITLYTADAIISSIKETLDFYKVKKLILCGYSMGGRAALSFATKHPEYISALILESTTAGIINYEDRQNRIKNDEKIASLITSESMEYFIDYWINIPLFESQKTLPYEKLEAVRKNKLLNNSIGLANSLKGFGTGSMPVLWDELKGLKFPVLLITGELDKKFTTISKEMVKLLPNGVHYIVPGSGHNVHLEKPEHFLNLTNEFLRK